MKRRIQLLPFVLLFFLASLSAQVPSQTSASDPASLLRVDSQQRSLWAHEWLSSDDPRHVAWGAWLAKQDELRDLIPVLIQHVEEYQPVDPGTSTQADRDRHDALLAVLDALITMQAAVPSEDAHKLYPEFPAQSLILLVRARDDPQPAMLDIFREAKSNWNWLAAGNVLLKNRTPGFAALLLGRFTQHLEVTVTEPGSGTGGSVGSASECMGSMRAPKPGWPIVDVYQLTQFPERYSGSAMTFLVGGPTNVYYFRPERGNYENSLDDPGACNDGNRDQYRAQYLNKLVEFYGLSDTVNAYPDVWIEWRSEPGYTRQLQADIERRHANFRAILSCLQNQVRALTVEESGTLKPHIEIVIRDERKDRSVPLPPVLENDPGVIVRSQFSKPLY